MRPIIYKIAFESLRLRLGYIMSVIIAVARGRFSVSRKLNRDLKVFHLKFFETLTWRALKLM